MNKIKKQNLIMLLLALVIAITISATFSYAMYKLQTPSSNNNLAIKNLIEDDTILVDDTDKNRAKNNTNYNVYVRAIIYTYWTLTPNTQDNELIAKNEWSINDYSSYINNTNWTNIDGVYYYKTILEKNVTAEYLVNNSIKSQLKVEHDSTGSICAVQSYRIVYEFIYAFENETNNSAAEAWHVTIKNNTVTPIK